MQTLSLSNILQKKFIGTDDLRKRLSEILEELPKGEGELVITQHGTPQAILMDLESYLGLQEQIADANPKLIQEINEAIADVKAGNGIPADQAFKELGF